MTKKSNAGAPTKAQAIKNKTARADESYSAGELKTRILLGENYHNYMQVLHDIATGKLKGNQGSAARGLVDQAEKLFGDDLKEEVAKYEEETTAQPVAQLISLTAKEA